MLLKMQNGVITMENSIEITHTHTHTHTHRERERERHLEIELLNDPAILYLGIYLNKIKSGYRSDITNHFT
jgi:hypothetical protein